jgi:hypothetical protein
VPGVIVLSVDRHVSIVVVFRVAVLPSVWHDSWSVMFAWRVLCDWWIVCCVGTVCNWLLLQWQRDERESACVPCWLHVPIAWYFDNFEIIFI